MPTGYDEIPGVYSLSPRPMAGFRKTLRTYRWCLVISSIVISIVIVATLISFMIGEAVDDTPIEPTEPSSEDRENRTVNTLLSLTWPRRDEVWYNNRWESSRMRNSYKPLNESKSTTQAPSRIKRSLSSGEKNNIPGHEMISTLVEDKSKTESSDIFWTKGKEVDGFDYLHGDDGSTYPLHDTNNWNRKASVLPNCTTNDIREALSQSSKTEKMKDDLESDLVTRNISLERNSPAYYHQKSFRKTSPRALTMSRQGFRLDHASKHISKRLKLNKEDTTFDSRWLGDLKDTPYCESYSSKHQCSPTDKYRSIDGTCNNLQNQDWGAAFTPFRRAMPPDYADGVMEPRNSKSGQELPNARTISASVHSYKRVDSDSYTLLTMAWGQFIDHDITATAQSKGQNGSGISCCHEEVQKNSSLKHPECLEIQIPENDGFYRSKNITCMELSRSASAARCSFGPREQLNQNTHFLDGSAIYGSSDDESNSLRTHSEGLLKTQVTLDGRQLLPPSLSANDSCNTEQQMYWKQHCFVSGDSRVNENILLTILHTIWTTQHNSVAQELREINPDWGDEELFQEARRIVIAQIQHITYHEYLPSILGPYISYGLEISPTNSGKYWNGYNSKIHPGLANGFAGAAFRFGHSMIQGLLQTIDSTGKSVTYEQLRKYYFNPFALYDPDSIGNFVRGQVSQKCAAVDHYFSSQVTNRLFQTSSTDHGLDLVAINIQRGRDHGIPSYTRWRMMCGLPVVKNFTDLQNDMHTDALNQIEKIYRDVDDIDLYTGGLAEKPIMDGLVGPTFACIIADQFIRLKRGDRFWYENGPGPNSFTKDQLTELHKTTFSRILCDNIAELGSVQRWPLRKFATDNPRLSCSASSIPDISLSAWEDGDI